MKEVERKKLEDDSMALIAQLQAEEEKAIEARRQEKAAVDQEQLTCQICLCELFDNDQGVEASETEVLPL